MMRKEDLAVIPTADLLSEMEALEIVGGVGEICDTTNNCNNNVQGCGGNVNCQGCTFNSIQLCGGLSDSAFGCKN